MKKNISKLLVYAEESVQDAQEGLLKTDKKNNINYIPKEYKGYISSFGAAITQSGLLPALYFNHQSEKSVADRKKLMNAVYKIIKKNQNINPQEDDLLSYAKNQTGNIKDLKNQILNAATALKLVIRTYKLQ
ncbi:MAG: type III-B CRISPR module-associated protein Cmr5 [Bacteroidales bacterium]|nr:type III-B CRISPR module-associated protein Cmr5 [Bacteroidales bacterium]